MPGKSWHEGGAHRAFGEEVPDQIRDAERDNERVHLVAGPEETSQDLIASEAKDAAGEGCGTGQAG